MHNSSEGSVKSKGGKGAMSKMPGDMGVSSVTNDRYTTPESKMPGKAFPAEGDSRTRTAAHSKANPGMPGKI